MPYNDTEPATIRLEDLTGVVIAAYNARRIERGSDGRR